MIQGDRIRINTVADRMHSDPRHQNRSRPWSLLDSVWYLIAEQRIEQNFLPPRRHGLTELAAIGDMLQ